MMRIITALLLAAGASYTIFFGPPLLFKAVVVLVAFACYWEYSGLVVASGIPRPTFAGLFGGAVLLFAPNYAALGLSLICVAALISALRFENLRYVLPSVAADFFGAIYAILPWHFAETLRARSVHWLFFALALSWAGDSAAYYVGRMFGKHRLAPVISPKKSWEGAIGSVVGSVVFGILYLGYFDPQVPKWEVAVIAVAANIAGQLGDLAESAMKRGAGVKDSGNILPGHGGMLDRVDSSLFALPVVYGLMLIL
jgi:phosphatidate cytidylyltransferase